MYRRWDVNLIRQYCLQFYIVPSAYRNSLSISKFIERILNELPERLHPLCDLLINAKNMNTSEWWMLKFWSLIIMFNPEKNRMRANNINLFISKLRFTCSASRTNTVSASFSQRIILHLLSFSFQRAFVFVWLYDIGRCVASTFFIRRRDYDFIWNSPIRCMVRCVWFSHPLQCGWGPQCCYYLSTNPGLYLCSSIDHWPHSI